MKKTITATFFSLICPLTQADTVLGVYAGTGIWSADYSGDTGVVSIDLDDLNLDEESNNFFFVALEHPVPLLPNIRLQHTDISSQEVATLTTTFTLDDITFSVNEQVNTDLELTHTDVILYYEILDNWANLDVGVNFRVFDGEATVTSLTTPSLTETVDLDEVIPMLYGRAQLDLPFTGISAGADVSIINYSGNTLSDFSAKLAYTFDNIVVDVGLELGYRNLSLEVDEDDELQVDLSVDGPYAAITVHF